MNRTIRYLPVLVLLWSAASAGAAVTVGLDGVDPDLEEDLLEAITLHRQRNSDRLTESLVKTLYQRIPGELRDALEARGYYHPSIDGSLVQNGEDWHAGFSVDTGPATRVTAINLELTGEGSGNAALRKAAAAFPLEEGDRLRHGRYETGKKTLQNVALDLGFLESEWQEHVVEVDTAANSAVIRLRFHTGERFRFGDITLPETVIARSILEGMLPFRSGDPYDLAQVIAYQQRLRDSDFFRDVDVEPRFSMAAEGRIPVVVGVTPNPRNAFSAGVGYGTDTGPRLVGGWDSRYFNEWGHRIETDLRISPVTSSLLGNYIIPQFRGEDVELGLSTGIAREDTDTRVSNSFEAGVKRLTQRWGLNESLSLSYRFEDFEVGGDSGFSNLLMPGIGYWYGTSDDPIYPRRGYRASVDLRGSTEYLISNVSFVQAIVRGKFIAPVGEEGRLLLRGQIGATAVSELQDLPGSVRFFAGGDNSIRGFDYQALGPENDAGEVIGGRYLAVGSVEYEHRVKGNWSVALFSDAGNAFNDFSDDLEYSVGTGVRWRSPVGLVRVDLAAGISRDDLPVRLHFVVGPDL